MGSGVSQLHEDDYKHFLELSPLAQQQWLRQIPPKEIPELIERTHFISKEDQHLLLNSVRDLKSRSSSRLIINSDDNPASVSYESSTKGTIGKFSTSSPDSITSYQMESGSAIVASNRNEILDTMIEAQFDHFGGVNTLSLVDLGFEFSVEDIERVFSPLLSTINLSRNERLTGDLLSFRPCTKLIEICLENTGITGDIEVFRPCTRIQKVLLSGLDVTGDISVFSSSLVLKKVWLRGCTNVTGNIERAFKNSRLLLDVLLRKTNVWGNIAVFRKCSKLQNLSLSRTRVSGTHASTP